MVCIYKMSAMPWGMIRHKISFSCSEVFFDISRGLFIIDGRGILRQITMNDLPRRSINWRNTPDFCKRFNIPTNTEKVSRAVTTACLTIELFFSMSCWAGVQVLTPSFPILKKNWSISAKTTKRKRIKRLFICLCPSRQTLRLLESSLH